MGFFVILIFRFNLQVAIQRVSIEIVKTLSTLFFLLAYLQKSNRNVKFRTA